MTFETNKPVVHYRSLAFINTWALVETIDHPYLSNEPGTYASTSEVVSYDETTGIFETANTVYVPGVDNA